VRRDVFEQTGNSTYQARLFFICHGLLAEVECTHNSFNDILP
jgi:hypothetical protein